MVVTRADLLDLAERFGRAGMHCRARLWQIAGVAVEEFGAGGVS